MRKMLFLALAMGLSFILVACEDTGSSGDDSYSSNLENALNESEASQTVPERPAEETTTENSQSEEQTTEEPPTEQESTPAPTPPVSAGDAISIGSISWLGDSYASARVTAKINSASTDGNTLYTNYEPYSWPRSSDGLDAICCLFYERGGRMVGGKFDWWRVGGQSSKTLENVKHGYNGHSMPARGSLVYTMIASIDGKQRSNIALVTWK